MKFFVPLVEPKDQEHTYEAIAKYNSSPIPPNRKDRIAALSWTRFGTESYAARVGEPAPEALGGEEVMAIIQTELSSFVICTPRRGVLGGQATQVNFSDVTRIEKFTG